MEVKKKLEQCFFCGEEGLLAANKKYCIECKKHCKRECINCHRPFPTLKYFNFTFNKCDACFNKAGLQKFLSKNKKQTFLKKKVDKNFLKQLLQKIGKNTKITLIIKNINTK